MVLLSRHHQGHFPALGDCPGRPICNESQLEMPVVLFSTRSQSQMLFRHPEQTSSCMLSLRSHSYQSVAEDQTGPCLSQSYSSCVTSATLVLHSHVPVGHSSTHSTIGRRSNFSSPWLPPPPQPAGTPPDSLDASWLDPQKEPCSRCFEIVENHLLDTLIWQSGSESPFGPDEKGFH